MHIRVLYLYESCQRHNYYVELTNSHGQTITPTCHCTGSLYNNFAGIDRDEARDRALIEAADWADFHDVEVEPYYEDGKLYKPSMTLDTYKR